MINLLKRHGVSIAAAIGSFVLGIVATDYGNFRSDVREVRKEASATNDKSLEKVSSSLRSFAIIAEGKEKKSEKKLEELRTALREDEASTRALSKLFPRTEPFYAQYEASVVKLMDSAEKITGPRDAKEMAQAVEEFLYRRDDFQTAIAKEQTSFVSFNINN